VYTVIESTPGYLPEDDDPATFDNIEDARVYASDLLSRLLDHIYEGAEIAGELPEDGSLPFEVSGSFTEDMSVIVYDKQREHDLGRVIEIVESEPEDVWQYTENAPEYASAVADLWHWSTNYDAGRGPVTLFLDLIGYSEDTFGEPIYQCVGSEGLGYVELDKLAKALTQYADRPQDVRAWLDKLMTFEEA
jgi:hypothetical protein